MNCGGRHNIINYEDEDLALFSSFLSSIFVHVYQLEAIRFLVFIGLN